MKIFIIDSYAKNIGDQAILLSTVEMFKKSRLIKLTALESSHPSISKTFKELKKVSIYPRIIDINIIDSSANSIKKFKCLFIGIYDGLLFFNWALFLRLGIGNHMWLIRRVRRDQAISMLDVELVVSSGGGYLSTHYNYIFRLYGFTIWLLLRKPIVIFAQSIGPFESIASKLLIPFFLHKAMLITVREPWTKAYLESLNLNQNIQETADLAVSPSISYPKESAKNKKVVICAKTSSHESSYTRSILGITEKLIKDGYDICYTSHTPNDDKYVEYLASNYSDLNRIKVMTFGQHPSEYKSIYASSRFVIASRMHAAIFAAENSVPFIAISYEPKFRGLFKQLKYTKKLLIHEHELNSRVLINRVNYLVANKPKLALHLRKIMPSIRMKTLQNIKILESME